jgi:hypothetical protein
MVLTSLAMAFPGGCAGRQSYSIRFEQPHKDVALVEVEVPARMEPAGYRGIAADVLRHVLASQRKRELPLYEMRFEFLVPSGDSGRTEKAATLVWRAEDGVDAPLSLHEEHSLVLY